MSWSCSRSKVALMGPSGCVKTPAQCSMRSMSIDVLALLLRSSHSCLGKGCNRKPFSDYLYFCGTHL